jgi:transposase
VTANTGLTATGVIDGAINGELFLAWVEQVLVPTLRCGDVVIMDSLGAHKVAAVRQAIEGAGARLLFIPPYSPDLNPIEQAFAKSEQSMRSGKHSAISSNASPRTNAPTSFVTLVISSQRECGLMSGLVRKFVSSQSKLQRTFESGH